MDGTSETMAAGLKHHQAGELDRAGEVYRLILETVPDHPDALHLLGVIAHQTGRNERAVERIRRAIAINPNVAGYHSNLGSAQAALGELSEAVSSYRRAVQIRSDCAEAHNNLGNALRRQGKLDEAVTSYRRALQIDPEYVAGLNNLGNALKDQGELDEAETCCRQALRIDPGSVHAHNELGSILHRQGGFDEAEACYQQALKIDPDYAEAAANLASLYEVLNRVREAAATAAACLRVAPDHPLANLITATCEAREGRHREAVERLEKTRCCGEPGSRIARSIAFQLGRLYDRIGDTARAFAQLTEANRLAMDQSRDALAERDRYLRAIDDRIEIYTDAWVDSWSPTPPLGTHDTPVFLVGFPRSGTTLLDVILDSHPSIQTLEEKPAVFAMESELGESPDGYGRAVPALTPAQIERLRTTYFRTADAYLDRRPGHLLIDKHPLNIAHVGLMLRIFPQARFVVAVRHPCDVCLSCFMQDFRINAAMANFFTLEGAAALYDKVMRLWRQYVRVLPHAYHVVRYEDLVDDFDGTTRRLLQFLEVEWDDGVRDYARQATKRSRIATPSYQQVTEPIYRRACNRWHRYAKHLEPVMDLLKPHIEYFGYESAIPSCNGRWA